MRRFNNLVATRTVAAIVGLGTIVSACSDIYYDRRETIHFGAADAVATNIALQTVDPWPPGSSNRNAPTNGDRVAAAIVRYRTGRVIPPVGSGTSSSYQQQQQQQQMPQQQTQTSQPASGVVTTDTGTQVK